MSDKIYRLHARYDATGDEWSSKGRRVTAIRACEWLHHWTSISRPGYTYWAEGPDIMYLEDGKTRFRSIQATAAVERERNPALDFP